MHPQIADLGYHILHVSPLGYVTPEKTRDELALPDGNWPVLPNTAAGIPGGYGDWLSDCLLAIRWAQAGRRFCHGACLCSAPVRGAGAHCSWRLS